ncbi:hypothetical protein MKQ68_07910 [Chitinophaga horti]|uniref:YD repeat-containing protein n=1 Tax=Chitinophaga horti TaxID=2920382 RepID=A0ABY6J8W1_9BACT|nr:hypothetical protein [Chitinophaga horti]UYQ95017.1 hypothetical protein MKQ68_07910 [Chitinophaga horti]
MKQTFLRMFAAAVCLAAISSCGKEPNPFHKSKQIDKIWGNFTGVGYDTLVYHYDHRGLPVDVTRNLNYYEQTQVHLKYDHFGRLTDAVYYWKGENWFNTWHRYSYKGFQQLPSTDTVYSLGFIGPDWTPQVPEGQDSLFLNIVWNMQYDFKGRITRLEEVYHDSRLYEFKYNQAGNLYKLIHTDRPHGPVEYNYTYGSAKSLFSTHPVWQLLSMDFSVNSRQPVVTVNQAGYPTKFTKANDPYTFGLFFDFNDYSGEMNITYKKVH